MNTYLEEVVHGSQTPRKALGNFDLNQMSHRYVSGVLQNEPSTSYLIDRCENVSLRADDN